MLKAALFVALLTCVDAQANACDEDPVWTEPEVLKAQDELINAYERAIDRSGQKELPLRGQQAWEDYREANCALMSDRGGEPAYEVSY